MSARHGEMQLTRQSLADGSLRRWLASTNPELKVWSDEQMQGSIAEMLATRPDGSGDAWVFGYGSLIWNPIIHTVERRTADVRGFHRRFCLWTHLGRGTAECPGLMLALERGGECRGVVYRLPADATQPTLHALWRREIGVKPVNHDPRWVSVETEVGPVRALAFTANPGGQSYVGALSLAQTAAIIARAVGMWGSCAEYLCETVAHLEALGIRDDHLWRLQALVAERILSGGGE